MVPLSIHEHVAIQCFSSFGKNGRQEHSLILLFNKIRDLFKDKLYAIRSETKKKREKERKEREKKCVREREKKSV